MYHTQIVDIFFAKQEYGPIQDLVEIKGLYQRIAYLNTYQENTETDKTDEILRVEDKIEQKKAKLIQK